MTKSIIPLLCLFVLTGCMTSTKKENEIKINQIQVIGSHNSYKNFIEAPLVKIIEQESSQSLDALEYDHVSIHDQLETYGLRNLEIDVVHDPEGGRFSKPLGIQLLQQNGITALPYDQDGLMQKPGFKVLHIPDIDFRSNCLTLTNCLREIKQWSDAHPDHLPIAITMNAKTQNIERPGFTELLPFTSEVFDALDAAVLSVIPKEQIILPDDVRGDFDTLEAAVLAGNWPTLIDARGKVLFVLDERGEKQQSYIAGHPSLKDRVMFVPANAGTPEAAFIILNYPKRDMENIQKLVKAGYLVRTRADEGTKEAREGDSSKFEAAIASGAHFISTDYYKENAAFGTGYHVRFPNGEVAVCNAVNPPKSCPKEGVE